jgi:hypothetical protein
MKRLIATAVAFGLAAGILTGCGGNGSSEGVDVSGTVVLGGKPVEAGLITFLTDDGKTASAELQEGGKFSLSNAPAGKVYIGVNTQMLRGQERLNLKQSKGKERGGHLQVPPRYADPKTSGLTKVLEAGKTIEIKLTP